MINLVEIQTVSWCNRTCWFCPSGMLDAPKAAMSLETAETIVNKLDQIGFNGVIGLHLICEPLLNKNLEDIIRLFRSRLPGVFIRIESNGDVLDKDFSRLGNLLSAGLNEIIINSYDGPDQWRRRNDMILDLCRADNSIWYLNKHQTQPAGPRRTWKFVKLLRYLENDDFNSFNTWGGRVDFPERQEPQLPLALGCNRPFDRLHLNYLGQVILCNMDWKFEVVAGDLLAQPLEEVWSSPILAGYRRALDQKDRSLPLCRNCDKGARPVVADPFPDADRMAPLRKRWYEVSRHFKYKLGVVLGLTGRADVQRKG